MSSRTRFLGFKRVLSWPPWLAKAGVGEQLTVDAVGQVTFEGPGGEEVADAVVREVQEETSVLVAPERITGVDTVADVVYPKHDRVCFVVTTFWCRPLSGDRR